MVPVEPALTLMPSETPQNGPDPMGVIWLPVMLRSLEFVATMPLAQSHDELSLARRGRMAKPLMVTSSTLVTVMRVMVSNVADVEPLMSAPWLVTDVRVSPSRDPEMVTSSV